MSVPKDMAEVWATTPLTFLFPKQDLINMFVPKDVQLPVPKAQETDPSNKLNKIRSVLNQDHTDDLQFLKDLILLDFEDVANVIPELEQLKFRKPGMICQENGLRTDLPQLGQLDKLVFDKFTQIERQDIVKPAMKIKRIKLNSNKPKMVQISHKQVARKDNISTVPIEEEPVLKKPKITSSSTPHSASNEITEKSKAELLFLIDQIGITDETESNGDLWSADNDNDSERTLSIHTLNRIRNYITRLKGTSLIHEIDIEYLSRIQNLCHKSLKKFTGSDVSIPTTESEFHEFYEIATNGAIATMTTLEILLSNRKEKVLYLESVLHSVVDFIYSALEDVVVPLAKLVISDDRLKWKQLLQQLQQSLKTILGQLNEFLFLSDGDEGFITRLEYLSTIVLFAEINMKEKTSVVGVSNFENLRIAACDIICTIFRKKEDQRNFILDEILANIDKIPTHKTYARQFKLTRGLNVQIVSILLVRLVQSFDFSDYSFHDSKISLLMNTEWDELKRKEKEELKMTQESFTSFALSRAKDMMNICNRISSTILNRFANIDSTFKHVFEIILVDLLTLVQFPEWAAAENLLSSIMGTLMYLIETDTYSASSQAFALEMIGTIGCKILQLKNDKDTIDLTSNMSIMNFKNLSNDYITCITFLQDFSSKFGDRDANSFNFLLLKLISSFDELAFQCKPQLDSEPSQLFEMCSSFQRKLMLLSMHVKLRGDAGQAVTSNLEEASLVSYGNILLSQQLLHLYDTFLAIVVKSLDHNKIKSRTRAIKNLSLLMAKEPSLLNLNTVSTSIVLRMNDNSLQVREAIIDLIDNFLSSKPEVIDNYYQIICQRMDDPSIAVRKRVVKLLKRMYTVTTNRAVKSLIAESLLRRLEDEEDNIIDLARNFLLEFWFLSLLDETTDVIDINMRTLAMSRLDVILDVIGKSEKNWDYFSMFLSEYVLVASEGDLPEVHVKLMKALKIIVDRTLDFVIECTDKEKLKKKVERAMGLLSIITEADGKLISQDQLICLKPYLTDESSTGDSICYYTLSIFRHALPQASVWKPSFVKDSQISLLKRLTKFSVRELGEAMPCAWMLSSMRNDSRRMATAAVSCLKLTRPFLDLANKKRLVECDPKLLRLLFLVGNFGKWCDFTECKNEFIKANVGLSESEPAVSIFVKFLLCFVNESLNQQIKRAAVKNLIYVCSSHPKLLMTDPILNIMDRELQSDEIEIKGVIVRELIEFLRHEEMINLKKTGRAENNKSVQLDVSVFHGNSASYLTDGICASLVQRYMEPVLQITLSDTLSYSILATRYLVLVVKLGFANPRLCIPYIIALESSPVFGLRSKALSMHKDLFEKHESLIESSYVEGVKLAFNYRKKLSVDYLTENHFFKTLFQVIGDNRMARRKFMISLMKSLCSLSGDSIDMVYHTEYTIFTIHNLISVDIANLEEAYLICNAIDKVISGEGLNLMMKISTALSEQSQDISSYCDYARFYMVLLRLREFLFQKYNLNEDKARDFKITEVDRELRSAPRVIKEATLTLKDILFTNKEDQQLIAQRFVQLMNGSQEVV